MQTQNKRLTLKISVMAMLTGLSLVLVALISFPIFPAAPFLKYDPADIPILICTFIFGPWAGLVVTFIVSLIQSLILGDFPYGFLMHFLATGIMVLVSGLIYRRKKTTKNSIVSVVFGIIAWVLAMIVANLVITPYYMGAPIQAVAAMIIPIIIPFNLIKSVINCTITLLLFKRLQSLLAHILKLDFESETPNKSIEGKEVAKPEEK